MGKKKKTFECEECHEEHETEEGMLKCCVDDEEEHPIAPETPFDNTDVSDNDDIGSSMQLAANINRQSDSAKFYKELPQEVKYSFLEQDEKNEIKHFSRTYNDSRYIEKTIQLREHEDNLMITQLNTRPFIKTREDIKIYLNGIHRGYLNNIIDNLKEEDLNLLLNQIPKLEKNYILENNVNTKTYIEGIYKKYNEENIVPSHIDDVGNAHKILSTAVVTQGYKGNAAKHTVMTISAVRNEDVQIRTEEKTKFDIVDKILKKFS